MVTPVTVVAFVDDLMDRSRLQGIEGIVFSREPSRCADADVVIVDLARHAAVIPEITRVAPDARIVAFGSHVDTDGLDAAVAAGADLVVTRSRMFRDPVSVIAGAVDGARPHPADPGT